MIHTFCWVDHLIPQAGVINVSLWPQSFRGPRRRVSTSCVAIHSGFSRRMLNDVLVGVLISSCGCGRKEPRTLMEFGTWMTFLIFANRVTLGLVFSLVIAYSSWFRRAQPLRRTFMQEDQRFKVDGSRTENASLLHNFFYAFKSSPKTYVTLR